MFYDKNVQKNDNKKSSFSKNAKNQFILQILSINYDSFSKKLIS